MAVIDLGNVTGPQGPKGDAGLSGFQAAVIGGFTGDESTYNDLMAQMPMHMGDETLHTRVRYGTFTGNGSGSRTLNLGFTPTILIMMSSSSSGCIISITSATYSYYIYGGGAGMSDSRIIENGIQIKNTLNNNSTVLCDWIALI